MKEMYDSNAGRVGYFLNTRAPDCRVRLIQFLFTSVHGMKSRGDKGLTVWSSEWIKLCALWWEFSFMIENIPTLCKVWSSIASSIAHTHIHHTHTHTCTMCLAKQSLSHRRYLTEIWYKFNKSQGCWGWSTLRRPEERRANFELLNALWLFKYMFFIFRFVYECFLEFMYVHFVWAQYLEKLKEGPLISWN